MTTLPRRSVNPDVREIGDRSVLRSIDQHIGQELRALYDEVLAEPVPDRFLALIETLGSSEPATAKAVEEVDA